MQTWPTIADTSELNVYLLLKYIVCINSASKICSKEGPTV